MTYNPFDKPIDEIAASDLNALVEKEVTEGYWVEYKRDFPTNNKIAKTIASLANTYGGWYFIGIEADKTSNAAMEVCGFNLTKVVDPVAEVRDVVRSHIDPVPVCHVRLLQLGGHKGVLVAYVPDSQECPFVTSDGRIYRRVGGSSDPVPENDRYTLDRLVSAGRDVARRFEHFCCDERVFAEGEHANWLKVFLWPQPPGLLVPPADWGRRECLERLLRLSTSRVEISILDHADYVTGNVPLDTGRFTNSSIIARQKDPRSVSTNSLTVEFFFDGRAKFFVPLEYRRLWDLDLPSDIKSPKVRSVLAGLRDSEPRALSLFDVEKLWVAVAVLVTTYRGWLDQEFADTVPYLAKFKVAMTLEGVWGFVPFMDADGWVDYVDVAGLPVVQSEVIRIPENLTDGFEVEVEGKGRLWLHLASRACLAFGLPLDLVGTVAASAPTRFATSDKDAASPGQRGGATTDKARTNEAE